MKRVLCYGDSNTWGFIPGSGKRYDENTRWTRLLQKLLGSEYEIIEEGFCGRNAGHEFDFYPRGNLNGATFFPQCVLTHNPIDFVVIMLGTNDLDARFNSTTADCAKIIEEKYIGYVKNHLANSLIKMPKIIIVAPNVMSEAAAILKDGGVAKKSKTFNRDYEIMAKRNKCIFVSNEGLETGVDGIHLTKDSHKKLAEALANVIK